MPHRYLMLLISIVAVFLSSETFGQGNVWKVTRNVVVGPSGFTNALTITRQQMTGLPDGIRSRIVQTSPDGVTSETVVAFDESTGVLTVTEVSDIKKECVTRKMHGLEIESETQDGHYVNEYDAFGHVTAVHKIRAGSNTRIPVCRMSYNALGDLTQMDRFVSMTNVVSESYGYDMFGNKTAVTDAHGNVATAAYDPFGHVVSVGGTALPQRFEYDTRGLRTAMRTTRDGVSWDSTVWTLNPITGQCTEKRKMDGSTTTFSYTADGLPQRTTFPDGRWVEKQYNNQRRLNQVVYSDGSTFQIQYDEFGMPTRVDESIGNVHEFSYGVNSVMTNEIAQTGSRTYRLKHLFDCYNRPTGVVYSVRNVIQNVTTYGYDGMNRILNMHIDGGLGKLFSITYTNAYGYGYGYVVSNAASTIVSREIQRDPFRGELVTRCDTTVGGGLTRFDYEYDVLGHPIARNGDSFGYDSRGQIIFAHSGDDNYTYSWDEAGNLTHYVCNGVTNIFTANNLNQYVSISRQDSQNITALSYSPNGGLSDDGCKTYVYDIENRLISVTPKVLTNGAVRVSYSYDYQSRRTSALRETYNALSEVWKETERDEFIYDKWNLICEFEHTFGEGVTNTVQWNYFWGCDLTGTTMGGGGVGGLVAASCNGNFYFPVYDSMGNILKYVDESGAIVAQYSYSPFGSCISKEGNLAESFRFRFSTKHFDNATGLYYFDFRYYNPEIMRWMTPDPSEERGGGNLYAFCNNAPVYSFDPNGLIRIPFITNQAKQAWENVIREVLDRRGWSVAALLMRHSLEPSPSDLNFGEGSIVVSKIKASPEYRQIIENLIAQQRETYRYYDSSSPIAYSNGDLFAGIGHATVHYKGSICKTKNSIRVDLDITVKDKYDFHFLKDYNKTSLDGILATIANNMAWSDQYFDVISVYSWEANFKESR